MSSVGRKTTRHDAPVLGPSPPPPITPPQGLRRIPPLHTPRRRPLSGLLRPLTPCRSSRPALRAARANTVPNTCFTKAGGKEERSGSELTSSVVCAPQSALAKIRTPSYDPPAAKYRPIKSDHVWPNGQKWPKWGSFEAGPRQLSRDSTKSTNSMSVSFLGVKLGILAHLAKI